MTASSLYLLSNYLMMPLWLLLIVSLFVTRWVPLVQRIALFGLPLVFGVAYSVALLTQLPTAEGSFDSLAGIRALFGNDWLLFAGWLHYLVFDFFVGAWVARDGTRQAMPRPWVAACLVGCFLAGPLGLLAYIVTRALRGRQSPRIGPAQA
jgi:hypothetical protein